MRNMLVRMIGLCWTRDSFSPTITFNTAWSRPGQWRNRIREQRTSDNIISMVNSGIKGMDIESRTC